MTSAPQDRLSSPRHGRAPNPLHDRYLRNRAIDGTVPWRVWLRERYARYWYAVGCLFVDMVIAATVLAGGPSPTESWQYVVAVALVLTLTVLELRLHRWLWPLEPVPE